MGAAARVASCSMTVRDLPERHARQEHALALAALAAEVQQDAALCREVVGRRQAAASAAVSRSSYASSVGAEAGVAKYPERVRTLHARSR